MDEDDKSTAPEVCPICGDIWALNADGERVTKAPEQNRSYATGTCPTCNEHVGVGGTIPAR